MPYHSFFYLLVLLLCISGTQTCHFSFKVYVYDFKVLYGQKATAMSNACRRCLMPQFALEYVLFDFFSKFCGRTTNPDEADYYFVPLVPDIEARPWLYRSSVESRIDSRLDTILMEAIEFNNMNPWKHHLAVTDKYWRRHMGADHIIVVPPLLSTEAGSEGARGFSQYLLQLNRPIFISSEYSKSFMAEFGGNCAVKNVILPFPAIQNEFESQARARKRKPQGVNKNSRKLIYYSGGAMSRCSNLRSALTEIARNITVATRVRASRRMKGCESSLFCILAAGDIISSSLQYSMIEKGCIPVLLADDLVFAYTYQAGGINFNETDFSVRLPQDIALVTAAQLNHLDRFGAQISTKADLERPRFGHLPLGTSIADIVQKLVHEYKTQKTKSDPWMFPGGIVPNFPFPNTLQLVLERIPYNEIRALQQRLFDYAPLTRYYKTVSEGALPFSALPTEEHRLPDGRAVEMLVDFLNRRQFDPGGVPGPAERCDMDRNKHHVIRAAHQCPRQMSDSPITSKRFSSKRLFDETGNPLTYRRLSPSLNQRGANEFIQFPHRSPWALHSCQQCHTPKHVPDA